MFGRKEIAGKLCHHTGHKSPCVKERCPKWITIQGTNPQTGEPVNTADCSDVWVPILLVDVARKLVAVDATTHNLNNELAKANARNIAAVAALANAAQRIALDREIDTRARQIAGAN